MSRRHEVDRRPASCEVGNGLPIANGKARSYYYSRDDGRRMLVVERRAGESLQINGGIKVNILEIQPGLVKLAIECMPDADAKFVKSISKTNYKLAGDEMNSETKLPLETLLALRANLQGGMTRMEDDSMNDHSRTVSIPTDMEELASDGANQEIMLSLLGSDEDTLDQIEAAIQRIESGDYGRCRECGEHIPQDRLDAIPYAADCVRCASREEEFAKS